MVGIHKFLRFELYGWIERKAGSGSSSKITTEVKRIVEEKMMRLETGASCCN